MIWAIVTVIVLYVAGIIATATLLYLQIQDHPNWAQSKTSHTAATDQVLTAVGASMFWPVTLLVFATIKARTRWLRRDMRCDDDQDGAA